MPAEVHESAVVEPGVELGEGVRIGPLCYVGAGVVLGDGTELVAHATVLGPARLGRNNRLFPYATLGAPPQDKTHRGEATELVVGDDNVFREQTTVHRGTAKSSCVTRIGSRCLFMVAQGHTPAVARSRPDTAAPKQGARTRRRMHTQGGWGRHPTRCHRQKYQ